LKQINLFSQAPAHYEFKCRVLNEYTRDQKEQYEKRQGDDNIHDYYELVENGGTTPTVHYTADKHTRFHAQIVKSGHATHLIHQEKNIIVSIKKVAVPIKYEYPSSLGSGSLFEPSFGSSLESSSLGLSQLQQFQLI
jgi:hypothetical protein